MDFKNVNFLTIQQEEVNMRKFTILFILAIALPLLFWTASFAGTQQTDPTNKKIATMTAGHSGAMVEAQAYVPFHQESSGIYLAAQQPISSGGVISMTTATRAPAGERGFLRAPGILAGYSVPTIRYAFLGMDVAEFTLTPAAAIYRC